MNPDLLILGGRGRGKSRALAAVADISVREGLSVLVTGPNQKIANICANYMVEVSDAVKAVSNLEGLRGRHFDVAVVDEAQNISQKDLQDVRSICDRMIVAENI